MIVRIRDFYSERTAREQRLILLMLAIAVPLLIWLLLVRPLDKAYDSALERHLEAIDRNGRVRALATAPRAAPPTTSAATQDVGLLVADSASRSGLTLGANASAEPGTVNITIPQGPLVAAMQWLRELEASGMRIEDLRMVPAGEGSVSVTARLARTDR